MSDDWRVKVTVADHREAVLLGGALERGEVAHDLEGGAGGRVVVSVDDKELFLYASTGEQAERVGQVVLDEMRKRGWKGTAVSQRWHQGAEKWEDPSAPVADSATDVQAAHAERIASEDADSDRYGSPEWEVRVSCHSHGDTVALAGTLRDRGIPSLRRWRYLLVGARDEDAAGALAKEIEALVPAGTTVTVEETLGAVLENAPQNPFAFFGGLGG